MTATDICKTHMASVSVWEEAERWWGIRCSWISPKFLAKRAAGQSERKETEVRVKGPSVVKSEGLEQDVPCELSKPSEYNSLQTQPHSRERSLKMESTLSRTKQQRQRKEQGPLKIREEPSPGRSLTLHQNNRRERQSPNQEATLTHLSFPKVEKKHFT